MNKAILFIIALGLSVILVFNLKDHTEEIKHECDCNELIQDALKGADSEIRHQFYLSDKLIKKINEQHRRIVELENELRRDVMSCDKDYCKKKE